ncbi:MAG: twin-arginine translocase TatA/TatE family subunit [Myxococcota bacterium]|nr:twin-arginine translocase TatA/TatE family subunit [Myxococcota bacterium]
MGAMFGIGPQELLVIMIVGLLVLGPKRLPEIARSLGRGMAEFRRASSDLRQSLSLEDQPTRRAPPPNAPAQAGADPENGGDATASEPVASPTAASDPAEGRSIAPSGHGEAADPEGASDTGKGKPPTRETPSGG